MTSPLAIALHYLIAINVLTFVAFGHDKWKAENPDPKAQPRKIRTGKKHRKKRRKGKRPRHARRRTPEATLLLLAVLGGSPGALLAMHLFRHKTLHKKFTLGIPLILVAQVVLAIVCAWLLTANNVSM